MQQLAFLGDTHRITEICNFNMKETCQCGIHVLRIKITTCTVFYAYSEIPKPHSFLYLLESTAILLSKSASCVARLKLVLVYDVSTLPDCVIARACKKFSLEQATKAQRVSRGIALPFHDLGA